MLALMSVAHGEPGSEPEASPLLVFDEIDAGIGGHTARAVGEHLRRLSRGRQMLCITHLPQVAALAQRHFTIVKHSDGQTAHHHRHNARRRCRGRRAGADAGGRRRRRARSRARPRARLSSRRLSPADQLDELGRPNACRWLSHAGTNSSPLATIGVANAPKPMDEPLFQSSAPVAASNAYSVLPGPSP